jgi:hypothetical protein
LDYFVFTLRLKELNMKKMTILSALLLGIASLGFSAGVFADDQNPVSQVVTGTTDAVGAVGQGAEDTLDQTGKTAGDAVQGTGDAVQAVGQGTGDAVKDVTNVAE